MAAGSNLIFNALTKPVKIEKNSAKQGGGLAFMSPVHFRQPSKSVIQDNVASDTGGGLYGFSSLADLRVASDHILVIKVACVFRARHCVHTCVRTCVRACPECGCECYALQSISCISTDRLKFFCFYSSSFCSITRQGKMEEG